MSGEYTYEFPDPKAFIYTLRLFLEAKKLTTLSELLQGAECSFTSSSQYSRVRWDTFNATLRITVMIEKFDLLTDQIRQTLLKYSQSIFPPDAGYELIEVEVSPSLSSPPDESIIYSQSISSALQRATYRSAWGEPSHSEEYVCDVFMIMPFERSLDAVYTQVVKPTVESLNLSIKRGDDPFTSKDIMYDVWSMLNACKVVIADCTRRNANVFFELGMAHTLGKPVIMLTQNLKELPYDVIGKRAIEYDIAFNHIEQLKENLKKVLISILPSDEAESSTKLGIDDIPF